MNRFSQLVYIVGITSLLVFFQNCSQFKAVNSDFGFGASEGLTNELELVTKGQGLYAQNCAACHGPIDTSTKLGRTQSQIEGAVQSIPQMSFALGGLTSDDYQAISAALVYQANGGGREISDEGRLLYSCTEEERVSRTPLLKLVNREFINSLNQILANFNPGFVNDSELNQLYDQLPADSALTSNKTIKEQNQLITQLSTNAYFETAYRASELVAGSLSARSNYLNCLGQTELSNSCHSEFVQRLASEAFRRNFSSSEANQLASSLRDNSLSASDQIKVTFTAITQMSEFQYKIFNRGQDRGNGVIELTGDELASRLSFLMVGTAPDARLRALGGNGQILNESTLSSEIDRLLEDPRAEQTIVRLFRESFGYDVYQSFSFPDYFRDGLNLVGLQNAMTSELDNFFIHNVMSRSGSFEDLFTSRHSRVQHASLATIYNSGQGVQTLSAERSGFLSRAAMLTKKSGPRASPILRGLSVLENVLCTEVGAPPPSAPTELPQVGDIVTTRENTELTSQAPGSSCVACHSRFNPLGYAFEGFDSLGRQRSVERVFDGSGNLVASLNIDTADNSEEIHSTVTSFSGARQLSSELGQSDKAMLCFAKHLKEFESRAETTSADNCQMNSVVETLYGVGEQPGSIRDAIRALVMSDDFRFWRY